MRASCRELLRRGKRLARRALSPAKPLLEGLVQAECAVAARWAGAAHGRLLAVQWGIPPVAENFEHDIDLYHLWPARRSAMWVERGVFSGLALKGGDVLDLCCGDGFYARNFFSLRSRRVVGVDFDPHIIATARRKHAAPNVEFLVGDIRSALPGGSFDNIVWDAAIEHFSPQETAVVFQAIRQRLAPSGVVSGYTIVQRGETTSLPLHEREFRSKEELLAEVAPHFAHVTVFETEYPERHNIYFWASDGVLPFGPDWPGQCRT